MTFTLELIPRGSHDVISQSVHHPTDPLGWNEHDAATVMKVMLRALDRLGREGEPGERAIVLRGISWIVSPYEGGVVIALDIPSGQAVAGPFAIDSLRLQELIESAIALESRDTTVH